MLNCILLPIFRVRSWCSWLSPVAESELLFWLSHCESMEFAIFLMYQSDTVVTVLMPTLFSVWPVGATLNWFLCSSDSTLFVLEYFLAFMCNKIVLAYPKNPLFLSFITEIIYEYILIRTVDNLCSMLSEVWRLSISSGWWIFFESFSFAFTYKLVLKALIFT